jgi:Tfp pilus assembly protein PilO
MTTAEFTTLAKKHPVSAVCLVVAIACGVVLYFRMDVVASSQAEYDARSAEAAKMIANVTNAPGLAEQLAEIQEQGRQLESRLVRAGQLAVNLQYFYKLEADNGVKLLDVHQDNLPRNIKTQFTPVPYGVTVQGSYNQVMKFLGQLQNGRHFCRINSAVFAKVSGGGENTLAGGQDISLTLSLDLLGLP